MNAYTADNLLAIWTDLNNVNLYLALAGNHVNAGSDNMTKYSLEKIYEIAEHGDTEP